ncbi:MAG TPA: 50S ribosomal protein L23 [Planctomycetaceae bacterium]|jgi:large subunit ribosomal protein L23|nr:50S ribosomal protein L23 [Planctomycetaceae bacterium]
MAIAMQSGVQLEAHQVVYRPVVTEKGTHLSERYNCYTFEVNPIATKHDIRNAVQELFKVRVVKVRTQNRVGKPRRHKMIESYTQAWKKAIVELHDEDRIAFF